MKNNYPETAPGWQKYPLNPVIGDKKSGTCFDAYIMSDDDGYRMYFSWRPEKSLAVCLSDDGIKWTEPEIVLPPNPGTGYEEDVNRNCVVKKNGKYYMWYTGQADGKSYIFYAESDDGYVWKRSGDEPVIKPVYNWEYMSVMNPCVIWDEDENIFKMWYSAGETYEPNVIGYATSGDGVNWTKSPEPIISADINNHYEKDRVGGCQVIKNGEWYTIFYIGYEDIDTARICMARSRDGKTHWEKHPDNPIISTSECGWDLFAVYKPTVMYINELGKWYLYYNGRNNDYEHIGLAIYDNQKFWE